jgi:hypothetical protein
MRMYGSPRLEQWWYPCVMSGNAVTPSTIKSCLPRCNIFLFSALIFMCYHLFCLCRYLEIWCQIFVCILAPIQNLRNRLNNKCCSTNTKQITPDPCDCTTHMSSKYCIYNLSKKETCSKLGTIKNCVFSWTGSTFKFKILPFHAGSHILPIYNELVQYMGRENLGLNFLHCLHYMLTPWSRLLLEKLISSQIVGKFPVSHGTWRFITAFTSACHLYLYWVTLITFLHYTV